MGIMKYLRPLRWVRAHAVALHDALGRIEGKLDHHRGVLNSEVEQQFQTSLEQAMLRIKKEIDRLSQEIRASWVLQKTLSGSVVTQPPSGWIVWRRSSRS